MTSKTSVHFQIPDCQVCQYSNYTITAMQISLFSMTVWPSLVKDTQLFTGEKDTYILLPQTIVDMCIPPHKWLYKNKQT